MATKLVPASITNLDPSLPDVRLYPVGVSRRMPSVAHEEARAQTFDLLHTVAPPTDLVARELAVMWDRHDWRKYLMPDIMLVHGVGQADPISHQLRRQYRIWHEHRQPDLVIEFASPSTVDRDLLGKKEDYAALGVYEYVQFDPLEELLRPNLRVYRLHGTRYQRVRAARDGSVPSSEIVGYDWLGIGTHLRLRDRKTGLLVPTPAEARLAAESRALQAEDALRRERAQAEADRAELARLRALLARQNE